MTNQLIADAEALAVELTDVSVDGTLDQLRPEIVIILARYLPAVMLMHLMRVTNTPISVLTDNMDDV